LARTIIIIVAVVGGFVVFFTWVMLVLRRLAAAADRMVLSFPEQAAEMKFLGASWPGPSMREGSRGCSASLAVYGFAVLGCCTASMVGQAL
jgi:hypothetical protein